MNLKLLITFFVYFIISNSLFGQDNNIYVKKQSINFESLLQNLEKKEHIRFFYHSDSIPDFKINISEDSISLYQLLNHTLSQYGINVSKTRYL